MFTINRESIQCPQKPIGNGVMEQFFLGHEAKLFWPNGKGDQHWIHPSTVGRDDDVVTIWQVFTIIDLGTSIKKVE